ncbi:MAG: hypothetical protein DMD72_00420 [Gemmatimonadetes bacterium]|nr:MAG: hypothetical protein DMD72_00420 [Gemmatimonadota bacterium]
MKAFVAQALLQKVRLDANTAKFLPLLALYLAIVLVFAKDGFQGDESRYVQYASNLTQGYYADPVYVLWNGPGYPLLLAPCMALGCSWLLVKLLNAFFLFGGLLYFYRTLTFYLSEQMATFFAFLLGLYPPILQEAPALLTEPLAFFLICAFCFYYCRLGQQPEGRVATLLAAVCLGWLALTKIFFGYVLLASLFCFLLLSLWSGRQEHRRSWRTFLLALILCMPYLFYTYTVTGRVFYWGNSGGTSAYWISTPYREELGDWNGSPGHLRQNNENLILNHGAYFGRLANLPPIEWDGELEKRALQNITEHPGKFLLNLLANIGRLLFSYPFSYTPQKLSTFVYLIPNMFLVVVFVLLILPAWMARGVIPPELKALLLVAGVAFCGSSLLSGYHRQAQILVPIILLWIAYVLTRVLEIRIRVHETGH